MKAFKMLMGSVVMAIPLLTVSGGANAQVEDAIRIRQESQTGQSNFTDCPTVFAELDCIGTNVVASQSKTKLGNSETRTRTIQVNEFVIHLHPDGSFEIGDLIAGGTANGHLEFEGLRSAEITGSVPLSDGSTAKVKFTLTGTGAVDTGSGSGPFPVAGCPSGLADLSSTLRTRDAVAAGQLTIGGVVQRPTVAAGPAVLTSQRVKGTCSSN